MSQIKCPNCQALNDLGNINCTECNSPLKKYRSLSKSTIIIISAILIMLITSIIGLIYLEVVYPQYGLSKRLPMIWEILVDKDFSKKYKKYKSLNDEIIKKTAELNQKKLELKSIIKKKEILSKLNDLNKRVNEVQEKLENQNKE